jgi:hypothetical protein
LLRVACFSRSLFHQIAYAHAENGNIELEHKESMRSTQQALFDAQAELQTLVEVTTVSHSFAACLHPHAAQLGEKFYSMRCKMIAETCRVTDVLEYSDSAALAAPACALETPAQEGDACISAFSQLQAALERLLLMSGELVSQGKEDSSRILKMDGEIKSGRAIIEGLREEVRNSVPRKPNTDMFTQTITVTTTAFSQTEPSNDDAASRRATPPVALPKPPQDMETLSQFLSKYCHPFAAIVNFSFDCRAVPTT